MSRLSRREVLGSLAIGSAALAGCLSVGASDDREPVDGVGEQDITTVETSCAGMNDEESSVDVTGTTIDIEGVLIGPNPCHEAVINGVFFEEDTVVVSIAAESDLAEGRACMECVGKISYEATVEVGNDVEFDEVRVDHNG